MSKSGHFSVRSHFNTLKRPCPYLLSIIGWKRRILWLQAMEMADANGWKYPLEKSMNAMCSAYWRGKAKAPMDE